MKNALANKVMAFAKIFGLNITSWKDNGTSINFYYNNNLLVGSISLETSIYEDEYISNEGYCFTLYTSIGKIKGVYASYRDTFYYSFARVNYNEPAYKATYGYASNLLKKDKHIEIFRKGSEELHLVKVIMSNTGIETEEKHNEGVVDTFGYTMSENNADSINLDFFYLKSRYGNIFGSAEISIEENKDSRSFCIYFRFLNEKYTREVKYNGNTFAEKLKSIDFNELMEEVKRECPHFLSFINSLKEELSFTYYGNKKINLYDTIANLCFARVDDPNYIISLAGQDTEPEPKLNRKI